MSQYATITAPLRQLLKKDAQWEWTEACHNAFLELKSALVSSPVLAHFSPIAPIFVSCDASGEALGVLSQSFQGEERPVAFASRALSAAERKYSEGRERHLLACCEHWHIYLYGRKFILGTDHQALTTILSPNGTGHKPLKLHRWVDRLYQYDFTPVYRPGSQNVADFLSRSVSGPTEESFDEPEVIQLLTSPFDQVITLDELKYASSEDKVLQWVRNYIVKGWPKKLEDADVMLQPFFNVEKS